MTAPKYAQASAVRRYGPPFGLLVSAFFVLAVSHHTSPPTRGVPQPRQPLASSLAPHGSVPLVTRLPRALAFEPNRGQLPTQADFVARVGGTAVLVSPEGLSWARSGSLSTVAYSGVPSRPPPAVPRMRIVGANKHARIVGVNQLPGVSNYYIGSDPGRWRTDVPTFAEVKVANVYPGIDLLFHGTEDGRIEYDFAVSPDADPDVIRVAFDGFKHISPGSRGDLVLATADSQIVQHAPVVFETVSGHQRPLSASHVLLGHNLVGFRVEGRTSKSTLVVDPVLSYSRLFGATNPPSSSTSYVGTDRGYAVAADSAGSAYLTGCTHANDFTDATPRTSSQPARTDVDAFVVKLNSDGTTAYSTYLGGANTDVGTGVAVDPSGNVYVTGHTSSLDFPVPNAIQLSPGGEPGATVIGFLAKMDSSGHLQSSTYLYPFQQQWQPTAIALDGAANIYVAGYSAGLPDAEIEQITSSWTKGYAIKIGGSGADWANGIACDSAGNCYVAGRTTSSGLGTTGTYKPASLGSDDAFVAKLDTTGTLKFFTYLGGASVDLANGIAIDSTGIYVTGYTFSSGFPATTTLPAGATSPGTVFVAKLSLDGSSLIYSTRFGSTSDSGYGVAVDDKGCAYVVGTVVGTAPDGSAPVFPFVNAFRSTFAGGAEAFITKLTAAGDAAIYSSYLGGSAAAIPPDATAPTECAYGVAVNNGIAYVVGTTRSDDFTGAPRDGSRTDYAAFAVKIVAPPLSLTSVAPTSGTVVGGTTVVLTGQNFLPSPTVVFDRKSATIVSADPSGQSITVRTPDHTSGSVDVIVERGTETATLYNAFTYGSPIITGLNPSSGAAIGGTSVAISGSNFCGSALVAFDGTAATNISVAPDGLSLTATSPSHAAGTIKVTVTCGTDSSSADYTYVPHSVASVTPAFGSTTGTNQVVIAGTNFTGSPTVTFGGTAATGVALQSSTSILATVPANSTPGAVDVAVIISGQSCTLPKGYTYYAPPTLSGVNPNTSSTVGGTEVTLTGAGFRQGATVTFGEKAATAVTVTDDTTITATAPSLPAGTVDITVANEPDGQSATLHNAFTYWSQGKPGGCGFDGSGVASLILLCCGALIARARRRS